MSANQSLHPRLAEHLFPVPAPRFVERSDRCISCGLFIKACEYGCHERSAEDPRVMAEPDQECCRACYACVFNCPREALRMVENPEFNSIGNSVYTPSIIRSLQEQAASGKIPVSGAGYGGAFSGGGFDNIWTDMSEIVRPTRDGIHGREHISTVVDLGRKISDLCGMEFDERGRLLSAIPPTREISLPLLFNPLPDLSCITGKTHELHKALAVAARGLTTYFTVQLKDEPGKLREHFNHLALRLAPAEVEQHPELIEWATILEFEDPRGAFEALAKARQINPHLLSIIRLEVTPQAPQQLLELVEQGAECVHLWAGPRGVGRDGATLIETLRAAHLLTVEHGVRDRFTLLASGGIAAAEHLPKAIILGADAVYVDWPLIIALGCLACSAGSCSAESCRDSAAQLCSRDISTVDPSWAATRMINLMLAWRDQLLEVLGAMGLRDVRRLRGETGRAIFADRAQEDFARRISLSSQVEKVSSSPLAQTSNLPPVAPAVRPAPSRFATDLSRYLVKIDRDLCTNCGVCVEACELGVHQRTAGKLRLDEPLHSKCIGTACESNDWQCVKVCPWEAIQIEESQLGATLGDKRWSSDLLWQTWQEAKQGTAPEQSGLVQIGNSGGGFDRLSLINPAHQAKGEAEVDLSIALNRRAAGPRISIPLPWYGGGMSYGSISLEVMSGRAMAAKDLGTFTSTGEGGYPDALTPYADHVITQIATGLFGVREETIQRSRLVEFKYAQGAKPGLGGHLLGEKNTPQVAAMREAVQGTSLFSPFPFHSVYSVEDHKKHLDWVRAIHPEVLISVKVSTPGDVDMVAVGAYYAGANIIHLDGGYGGTGAAPDIAKKNIAQPIEYAIVQVHDFLVKEGIRDEITVMASGGIRSVEDVLKAIALGADGVVLGTAELVAIDCVRCGNCERDRGCPIGIATTDPVFAKQLTPEWVRDRIVNMYLSWSSQLRARLAELGLDSIAALRGRRDLLHLAGRKAA